MSVPEIAPGSAAHLKLVTEFYRAEPKASVFTSAYRDLLAHRYNLLIPEDARVLEVGCGAGELLTAFTRAAKSGSICLPNRSPAPGRVIRFLISGWPTENWDRFPMARSTSL